jgi:hypothetical protein
VILDMVAGSYVNREVECWRALGDHRCSRSRYQSRIQCRSGAAQATIHQRSTLRPAFPLAFKSTLWLQLFVKRYGRFSTAVAVKPVIHTVFTASNAY